MARFHLLASLPIFVLGTLALAQTPVDGPPWWGKNDEVTVSLYWSFDNPATLLQPTFAVTPTWYQPSVTQMSTSSNVQAIGQLGGRTGVLGIVGTGQPISASIDLVVDNDPHLDWIKVFFVQFDAWKGTSGDITANIDKILADYERVGYSTKTQAIGGGWERVTVEAMLYPQPDDEELTWNMVEMALGTVGVDDLFVNSKCIKYGSADDALGEPGGFVVDLTANIGQTCVAAAVTEGPAPGFARTYWISTLGAQPNAPLEIVRLNQAGAPIGTTLLPNTATQVPNGASDLAVETAFVGGQPQQFIYALLDRRGTPSSRVDLVAIDTTGGIVASRSVALVGFPNIAPQDFGLAFDPTGDGGAGTFWVTDTQGNAYEWSRSGALLTTLTNLPPGVVGAGYDDDYGNFYFWSRNPRATPIGALRVNGFEWSGYSLTATGTEFCGNLNLPNPTATRGGIASGLEVYRRRSDRQFRMVCVAQLQSPARSVLYELHGPYRYGRSLAGRCGMRGGPPIEGSTSFTVTLQGRPDAVFAALYAGFSKASHLGTPLPSPLAPFGFEESYLSIALDLNSVLQLPSPTGDFAFTLPLLPPGSGFSYVPFYFQWVVFDPTLPGGLALSQPAQTVIY